MGARPKFTFTRTDILAMALIVASIIIMVLLRTEGMDVMLGQDAWRAINYALFTIIVICITWLVTQYLGKLFERLASESLGGEAKSRSTWKLISYIIWIIVAIFLLMGTISDPGSMALVLGLIGAALTFVLQQPLLNMVAWFIISTRGLYKMGDRISIAGSNGYVVDITIMQTDIREFGDWMVDDNFTGRIVSIPNAFMFQHPVINYTRDSPHIWDEVRTMVSFDSDVKLAKELMFESAKEVVGESMRNNYKTYQDRMEFSEIKTQVYMEPRVKMAFAESGVEMAVIYLTPVNQRWINRSEITERVWSSFNSDPRVRLAVPHRFLEGMMDRSAGPTDA